MVKSIAWMLSYKGPSMKLTWQSFQRQQEWLIAAYLPLLQQQLSVVALTPQHFSGTRMKCGTISNSASVNIKWHLFLLCHGGLRGRTPGPLKSLNFSVYAANHIFQFQTLLKWPCVARAWNASTIPVKTFQNQYFMRKIQYFCARYVKLHFNLFLPVHTCCISLSLISLSSPSTCFFCPYILYLILLISLSSLAVLLISHQHHFSSPFFYMTIPHTDVAFAHLYHSIIIYSSTFPSHCKYFIYLYYTLIGFTTHPIQITTTSWM